MPFDRSLRHPAGSRRSLEPVCHLVLLALVREENDPEDEAP